MADYQDYLSLARSFREAVDPSPATLAQQRGLLGQAAAGVGQAVTGIAEMPFRALSAVPGIRPAAEPVAEFIEQQAPLRGPGMVERGVEAAGTSLGILGIAASTLGVGAAPFVAGGLYGLAQVAETRNRLEQFNAALVAKGQEPLSEGDIYAAAVGAGAVEAIGETAASYFFQGRFFPKTAAGLHAARNYVVNKLLPEGTAKLVQMSARGAEEYGRALVREVPTEMGQAAGQTQIEREALGPERLTTLGQPLPTATEAAMQVVGPTAVSAAITTGAGAVVQRVTRPQGVSGGETATAAAPPSRAPVHPGLRPRPAIPVGVRGVVNPLTGEGEPSTPVPPVPAGFAPTINPLTGEQALAPELVAPVEAAVPPPVPGESPVAPVAAEPSSVESEVPPPVVVNPLTGEGEPSTPMPPPVAGFAPTINPLTGEQALPPPAAPLPEPGEAVPAVSPELEQPTAAPESIAPAPPEISTALEAAPGPVPEEQQLAPDPAQQRYEQAVAIVRKTGSTSEETLSRALPRGSKNQAGNLLKRMEREGVISTRDPVTRKRRVVPVSSALVPVPGAAAAAPPALPSLLSATPGGAGMILHLEFDTPLQSPADVQTALQGLAPHIQVERKRSRISGSSFYEVQFATEDGRYLPIPSAAYTHLGLSGPMARGQEPPLLPSQAQLGATGGVPETGYHVTRESLEHNFPGQQIQQFADGTWAVTTQNGGYVQVQGVSHIALEGEANRLGLALGYGPDAARDLAAASRAVHGLFQPSYGASGTILIREGVADALTLTHESVHFFEHAGIFSGQDIRALTRRMRQLHYGDPTLSPMENRANYVAAELNTVYTKPTTRWQRAIATARHWLDRLLRSLGLRTAAAVIRDVQRGSIFERPLSPPGGQVAGGPPQFALSPATPRDQPPGTPVEEKPFTDYASFTQLLTPEEVAHFTQLETAGQVAFRKESISDVSLASAGEQQLQDWRNTPEALQRFLEGLHRGTAAATEAQWVALNLMKDRDYQTAKVLRDQGIMTPERFEQFELDWLGAANIAQYATMAASTFGRGLRAQRMIGSSPYYGGVQLYEDARKWLDEKNNAIPPGERAAFKDKLRQAFEAQDYTTLQQLAQQIPSPTLRQLFFEFYYGSILSGVGTHSANEYSTAGWQLFHNALVRPLAGAVDTFVAGLTGRPRQIYATEALPAMASQLKGLPQSFRHAWWLWRGDVRAASIPGIFRQATFEQQELGQGRGAWERATWQTDLPALGITAGQPIPWMRKAAPFVTAASRLMSAMDVGLTQQAFEAEVAARARRHAVRQTGSPDAALEADYRQHFLTRQSKEAIAEVLEHAKVQVFRDAMGPLGRMLVRVREIPVLGWFGQLLLPFASTPDRLLARGLELLPGWTAVPWLIKNSTWKWGGFLPLPGAEAFTPEAEFMLAKQVIGTLMTMAGYALWASGSLTGGVPEDPAEREAFYRQGKVPYAVKVGDTWYSWRRFEPMNLPLGMWTTVFEAMERLEKRKARDGDQSTGAASDSLALASVAVQSALAYVIDSSYFAGLANFLETTRRGREAGDVPRGVLRQVASMVTPFVGLQRSLIRALDASGLVPGTTAGQTQVRRPEGFGDTLAGSWLPLAFTELGAKPALGAFGQPQGMRTTSLGELVPLVPPVQRGGPPPSQLEQTLQEIGYAPGLPSKIDVATGKTIPAATYRALTQRRGELMQDRMEALVESPSFQRLSPDAQKQRLKALAAAATQRAKRELRRDLAAAVSP